MGGIDEPENDVGAFDPSDDDDDRVELVLATKENTKNVGWLVTDGKDSIEKKCNIPFYDNVAEGFVFPEADWKDQAVVRQAQIDWRDELSLTWMERHMEMTQGFMLIGKSPGLMVLGEPTHDRHDLTEEERRWPDRARTRGYLVPAGCGIILRKGTWHDFPVSVGPEVTAFIINTKEVVDALTSMKEAGPMDFGDCYKVRLADRDGRRIHFPDPRPFAASLGLLGGSSLTSISSDGSFESALSSEEGEPRESSNGRPPPGRSTTGRYGRGMRRTEAGPWGGPRAGSVWVVPVVNVEAFDPDALGPSAQPRLNGTRPEVANRGWREYGNRRGLERLGRTFGGRGIPCTAVVSSDLVDDEGVMDLLRRFEEVNGWEIGAHGANNSNGGHAGLSETEEAEVISRSLKRLGDAFQGNDGDGPRTWLTPGFSVTSSTPKLLSDAGVETLLDFVDDDVPFELTREETHSRASPPSESSLVCIPYSMETNDFSLVLERRLSPREYAAAIEDHIVQLAKESRQSGTPSVVCLGMHTFVAGTPASANELDRMLGRLESRGDIDVKWATAREVTECVRKGGAAETNNPSRKLDHAACPGKANATTPSQSPDNNKLWVRTKPTSTTPIDRGRLGLLLVDFQNDFLCRGGFGERLGNDPSKLRRAIGPTREVLDAARRAGVPVFHTREGHRPNLADATPLKRGADDGSSSLVGSEGANGRRCMVRGGWGNEIIPELRPLPDGSETVIDKPGKGAFYQTDFELVLRNSNVDTLVVCGVTTEICVHSTVREANDRGIRCIVLEDCTASYFDEFHRVGLEMIAAQGGILGTVSDSISVIDALIR